MTTAIEIKDLFHIYPGRTGGVAAIRGLNFQVNAGEVCVVRGPNGSGKSTLTEILAGTLRPSAGTVSISGQIRRLRQFGNTVAELTISEYLKIVTPDVDAVLAQWNIAQFRDQRLGEATPGIQQLASAAAVLATTPKILLADEPAGALSRPEATHLYEQMTEHCRNHRVALVMVTHDRFAEQFADRVVRISDGRLSEEWTGSESEQSIVDQHGWLRLPKSLGLDFPGKARVELDSNGVLVTGLDSSPQVEVEVPNNQQPGTVLMSLPLEAQLAASSSFTTNHVDLRRGETVVVSASSTIEKMGYLRQIANLPINNPQRDNSAISIHLSLNPIALDLSLHEAGASAEWIERVGANAFAHQPMRTLSGGQLQKAQLAIALTQARDVLILDEPTSALDEENRRLVCAVLQSVEHLCLVIATNDEFLVAAAQHVIVLKD